MNRIISYLFLVSLIGCGDFKIAGSGSELPNTVASGSEKALVATIVDESGNPLAKKEVLIEKIEIDQEGDQIENIQTLMTNNEGILKTDSLQAGIYALRLNDSLEQNQLFIGRIIVHENSSIHLGTLTAKPGINVTGTLQLPVPLKVDSAIVMIPGLNKKALVSADGTFELKNVPRNIVDLAFIYGDVLNFGAIDLRSEQFNEQLQTANFSFFAGHIPSGEYYKVHLKKTFFIEWGKQSSNQLWPDSLFVVEIPDLPEDQLIVTGEEQSSSSTVAMSSSLSDSIENTVMYSTENLILQATDSPSQQPPEITVVYDEGSYLENNTDESNYSGRTYSELNSISYSMDTRTVVGAYFLQNDLPYLKAEAGLISLSGLGIELSKNIDINKDLLMLHFNDDFNFIDYAWATELGISITEEDVQKLLNQK